MYNVYVIPKGRLGNALFRYFAARLIAKNNNLNYNGLWKTQTHLIKKINDEIFLDCLKLSNLKINLLFDGFYQYQELVNHKKEIKKIIKENGDDILYEYPPRSKQIRLKDLFSNKYFKEYDFLIHVRLEDFMLNTTYIRVKHIINLLNNINFSNLNTIGIVVNAIKTSQEKDYMNKLINWFREKKININIESNDIITDFNLLYRAKILLCSNSTICWCAAFLSNNLETCYMPAKRHALQTFKLPIKKTILYNV